MARKTSVGNLNNKYYSYNINTNVMGIFFLKNLAGSGYDPGACGDRDDILGIVRTLHLNFASLLHYLCCILYGQV